MEYVLDDSNPMGKKAVAWDQRPGTAAIGEDMCPAVPLTDFAPSATAADIKAAANNDFLDANPAPALTDIKLSVMDVSIAIGPGRGCRSKGSRSRLDRRKPRSGRRLA